MREVQEVAQKIINNVERVIVGKSDEVQLVVMALICQGHVLIEDVPGVGKTMLAKSLARSLGCTFKRIQFTPDMLPSDITGVSIFNQKTLEFEFRPGPVMAQVILTDEINRATPKTQSALLECMEERQITVDGTTYKMSEPFLVLATQNPIEYEGTFPLPEAQLDRFLMRVILGYPDPRDEIVILDSQRHVHPIESIGQVATLEEVRFIQRVVKDIYIDPLIKEYIVTLVGNTRNHPEVYLGASPRGSLALYKTSQARAALVGRDYVIPDDIKALAVPTLAHRLIINPSARMKNIGQRAIVEDILDATPVPGTQVKER